MSVVWQVGDGTTSVVLLACEFLNNVKTMIEDGVHPQIIVKGFRQACQIAQEKLRQIAIDLDRRDEVYVFVVTS